MNVPAPWWGAYIVDMNVQEVYWPIYTGNYLELGLPLYKFFLDKLPKFKEQCKKFYGFEGSHCDGAISIDGSSTAYIWYSNTVWTGNGAWISHHFWLHWLYSKDKEFLEKQAYPFMKTFMQTYLNLLEKGEDGKYHIPLSSSPEYNEGGMNACGKDTTCDLFLIKWLAKSLMEIVKILKIKDEDEIRWKDVLDNLIEPCVAKSDKFDENGLLIWDGQALEDSHRHHSHLMGIYPLDNLNIETTDKDRDIIEKSLYQIRIKGTGKWTGWSFPWMSMIASRVGKKEMAWKMLQDYFCFIAVNGLHINGDPRKFGLSLFDYDPMTIEATPAFSSAAMEMLLQSWNGIIRIFPAVPEFWHNAYFKDLRAEGGFLMTAKMENREIIFIDIKSEVGGECRIKNPYPNAEITNLKTKKSFISYDTVINLATKPGDVFRLTINGRKIKKIDLMPDIPNRTKQETNWFGLKKLPRF